MFFEARNTVFTSGLNCCPDEEGIKTPIGRSQISPRTICLNCCPDEEGIKTPRLFGGVVAAGAKSLNCCPDEEGIKTEKPEPALTLEEKV